MSEAAPPRSTGRVLGRLLVPAVALQAGPGAVRTWRFLDDLPRLAPTLLERAGERGDFASVWFALAVLAIYAVLPFTVDVVAGVQPDPPRDFLGSWDNFASVGLGRMVVHLLPAGAFFVLGAVEDAAVPGRF